MTDHRSCVQLNTGVQMPLLGLGTYRLQGREEIYQTVDAALTAGYRAFDTAAVYRNEADIGQALCTLLPKHGLSRAEVFITTKLSPKDQGWKAKDGCLRSLEQLGLDYIDLFLIHWPGTQGLDVKDKRNPENRAQSWATLEEFHAEGKFRAIGVSNYTVKHMEELLKSCTVIPAVLQVEFHPRLVQRELRELCEKSGVCFQAYSSLGTGVLLSDPLVLEIAGRYGKTPAQVLLRWAVQQNIPVLPKSCQPNRVQENGCLFDFELSDGDMATLSALDCREKFCWDPSLVL
ncbi:glyoxal reductase [Ictalurus punctatus]|uniref:Glyoxal reductase n=1 Tax=Ictalurus punctatus TaxID=7998 RepID=W5UGN3_ICTPU|nr:glyoxal reductase [Ictalurus punctatus]XP_017327171.1 glyoxal reductase [Ictalurus punctatus]XP_053537336.1 glyoxal reductase [Ictalurus punctatus]XP_053537337.1 glyoxal reductase [Ictalurus punctatus]